MACRDLRVSIDDEEKFVRLGQNEHRRECIENFRAMIRLVGVIIVLGEKMAETRPRCHTVRKKPANYFFGPFERACNERIKAPLRRFADALEANERSGRPNPTVDFAVANDLDAFIWGHALPSDLYPCDHGDEEDDGYL